MSRRMAPVLSAIVTLATLSPAAARPGVGLGQEFPQACGSGYRPDKGGNCQPNGGETNRYCPTGLVMHPAFNGWTCDPAPPEAY
jgi:hypothetical protein